MNTTVHPLAIINTEVYLRVPFKVENQQVVGDFYKNLGLQVGDKVLVTGVQDGNLICGAEVMVDRGRYFPNPQPTWVRIVVDRKDVLEATAEERTQYRIGNGQWFDSEKEAVLHEL